MANVWCRRGLIFASLVVSIGLVAWLFSRLDYSRVRIVLGEARWEYLAVAALLTLACPCTAAWRWLGVLRAQSATPLDFAKALNAVLLASAVNSVVPSKAGDFLKAWYVREARGFAAGAGTVLVERAVDLFVLGVMATIGGVLSELAWGVAGGIGLAGAMLGLLSASYWVPFQRLGAPTRIADALMDIQTVTRQWARQPRAMLQTVLGSIGTWGLGAATLAALCLAFGQAVPVAVVLATFPLAVLAGLVPLTISGVGTRDAAFVLLLSAHVPVEEATLIGFGYTVFAYWFLTLIGLPAALRALSALAARPSRTASVAAHNPSEPVSASR
ncbi:MAG: lysylphosphatidylglycerol synthase transmembrane domain-containing protein [Planctomycetota bacterium]